MFHGKEQHMLDFLQDGNTWTVARNVNVDVPLPV